MIGIICITSTLILDESESADRVSMHRSCKIGTAPCLGDVQSACSASWGGNVAAHKASIAKGVLDLGAAEAMRQAQAQDEDGKTRVGIVPIYRWYWRAS